MRGVFFDLRLICKVSVIFGQPFVKRFALCKKTVKQCFAIPKGLLLEDRALIGVTVENEAS